MSGDRNSEMGDTFSKHLKAGERNAYKHIGKGVLGIVGFAGTASGAVYLAGPAIIHEVGAQVDIPRTFAGVIAGAASALCVKYSIGQHNQAIESVQEGLNQGIAAIEHEIATTGLEYLDNTEEK